MLILHEGVPAKAVGRIRSNIFDSQAVSSHTHFYPITQAQTAMMG